MDEETQRAVADLLAITGRDGIENNTASTTRRAFSRIHKTKWPAWNATRIRYCCEQTLRVCDIMR